MTTLFTASTTPTRHPDQTMAKATKPDSNPRNPRKTPQNSREEHRKSSQQKKSSRVTAETLAGRQREISVSEFFAKNRHLLGFDNPRKAMLTTVKEAVDNALDACEEANILPDIFVQLLQLDETRFKITVRDNGPGIVRKQVENIFGRLLYGSKFHRLKMSRGQQGIGISAAGMYGLMTTGKPVLIISKTSKKKPAHEVLLKMDTSKNRPEVVSDTEHPEDNELFPDGRGTQVVIEMEGRYLKGRQSVDEYLEQTAIANPHARITYVTPGNETIEFPRAVEELPAEPREIKPHPEGIELGTLIQMLERTESTQLGAFLQNEFCRVSLRNANKIAEQADTILGKDANITNRTWVKQIGHTEAEAVYKAVQKTKFLAPPTDCLEPIGSKALLAGLLKEVKAEFYTAATRPTAVYRGNPFQIEVAIAYGGKLPTEETARVLRFANRVPLLYQQSGCSSFKAAVNSGWKKYGLNQPRGGLPVGPLVIMIHMASVWVPFTSESKEAIADYDEIRKEMRLALQECGRKLGIYLRKRKKMRREAERRNVFERYIGEIAKATAAIIDDDAEELYHALVRQAQRKTAKADQVLDDEGNVIPQENSPTKAGDDDDVIIIEDRQRGVDDSDDESDELFGDVIKKNGSVKKKRRKKAKG